ALVAALDASRPDTEPPHRGRQPTEADRAKAEQLRQLRAAKAVQLGLDPGVLCPSRTLMSAVMSDPSSPSELRDALGLQAWTWEQLGAEFCQALGLGPGGNAAPDSPNRDQERTHG
ncbi:MAG: HRDC domain-containing protein, partial [Egibacteraceae bacterium]